eukprot:11373635-Heterocapsa_arctica.AAC.1
MEVEVVGGRTLVSVSYGWMTLVSSTVAHAMPSSSPPRRSPGRPQGWPLLAVWCGSRPSCGPSSSSSHNTPGRER